MCIVCSYAFQQVEEMMSLRERWNALCSKSGKMPKLSVNDFVIKAAAKALKDVPGAGPWSA